MSSLVILHYPKDPINAKRMPRGKLVQLSDIAFPFGCPQSDAAAVYNDATISDNGEGRESTQAGKLEEAPSS
jgi:hypothetical protein